jgi:hypothetical protein
MDAAAFSANPFPPAVYTPPPHLPFNLVSHMWLRGFMDDGISDSLVGSSDGEQTGNVIPYQQKSTVQCKHRGFRGRPKTPLSHATVCHHPSPLLSPCTFG